MRDPFDDFPQFPSTRKAVGLGAAAILINLAFIAAVVLVVALIVKVVIL